MMLGKFAVFLVLALCLLAGQGKAQECSTESVVNLKLEASHLLTWSLRPGEACEVSEYLIYIFHPGQPAEYAFSVKERSVDVSFLEVCEEWTFVVVPVSGHTMGGQRRIVARLPLPSDADLSLAYLNVLQNATSSFTRLYWDLSDNRLGNCSLRYRVTVEKEGSPVIEDFYVDRHHLELNYLPPCTRYQFGVRAINIASPTIEGPLKTGIHDLFGIRQYPPIEIGTNVGPTTATMYFRLESEIRNPCPLRQLYVESGSISQTVALSNEGERLRVNVTVTNLSPSTNYRFNVYVSNTAGWSNATIVELRTLDPSQEEPEDSETLS